MVKYSIRHKGVPIEWRVPKNSYDIFKERKDITCDICGGTELVTPYRDTIILCPNCARKLPTINKLFKERRAFVMPNIGNFRCRFCGAYSPTVVVIMTKRVCMRCLWYKLGKSQYRLSVAGDRWF